MYPIYLPTHLPTCLPTSIPTHLPTPPTHLQGEYLAKNGLRTFACSETQKFGHVTFFWNGNRSGYFDESLETYVEIPSDNCIFNEKPLMKARRPRQCCPPPCPPPCPLPLIYPVIHRWYSARGAPPQDGAHGNALWP